MKKEIELKNRISARRAAFGYFCGRRGYEEQKVNGETQFAHAGFTRGTKIHKQVEDWSKKKNVIPDEWKNILPRQEDIISAENRLTRTIEGLEPYIIGIPDLVAKDNVIHELKTGEPAEWHKLQVATCSWLIKSKKSAFIDYLDKGTQVEVKLKLDDQFFKDVWQKILAAKPEKCELCKGCPIKSTCKLWITDAIVDSDRLVNVHRKMKKLESKIKKNKDRFAKILLKDTTNLKRLEVLSSKLKNRMLNVEPMTYKSKDGSTVRIQTNTTVTLPENYLELRPYNENKEMYRLEPKKVLKDDIGVIGTKQSVIVTIKKD